MRDLRRNLDLDRAKLLATALVFSYLNYCNSPLYGITDTDPTKLRCIQNRLAHLVIKSSPFTRSVPRLRSLHWLPVAFRILFKINLLTYKTLCEKNILFIFTPMLVASLPSCSVRSSNGISLSVPRYRVKTNTGAGALHSCALSLWNNLPPSVHSTIEVATFKTHLKIHLLDLAFPL